MAESGSPIQVSVTQQALEARRDFVGKVHDRADLPGVQDRHAADDGRAGPHVTATYGTREDQDVCGVLFRAHRSIILRLRNHPKRPYPPRG